ncbi:SMI1/KNR4 family protein [Kitasatospora sp. NPDC001540]|uniref:SMI1/KNR4 family protein n=1 Tax=Kitasatospora sp. NPDC001540 TaxID=3364014 RepID=UPI00369D5F22
MNDSVRELPPVWSRVRARLADGARPGGALRPAADPAALDAHGAPPRRPLPADLRAWWLLPDVPVGYWLPGDFSPLAWPEALAYLEFQLQVAEGESFDAEGRPEPRYLPEFLPIAHGPGGDTLFVDLRPGEDHGSVRLWDHETWQLDVPWWPSVTAMLLDVARALETGAPVLLGHRALGGSTPPATVAGFDADGGPEWVETEGS